MSGRRAKQRRRLVWLAECGDQDAQHWCLARMTVEQIQRATRRYLTCQARRAGRRAA